MNIVIDNNILFSAVNPFSSSAYLFDSLNVSFYAPRFLKNEINKYKEICMSKARISEQEFEMRLKDLFSKISFFDEEEYSDMLIKAIEVIEDYKDAPYLALAMKYNLAIWSNDSDLLKQKIVRVFSTREIIDLFLEGKL